MKTVLLFFLTLGLLWTAGVRVYPETLREYGEILIVKDFRRVESRSGKFIIGEFMAETPEGVRVKTDSGPVLLPASSIAKTKQLVLHEVFDAMCRGELPGVPKTRPIEYHASENHLLPLIQELRKKINV